MGKKKNIPKLRFRDDNGNSFPEWAFVPADKLFRNNSNRNHNSDLPILAATQEYGMQYRDEIGIMIISSNKSIASYKVVDVGDFIISLRSFQGGIEYSNLHGICSPAYTVLKPLIQIDHKFFKFYFKKDTFITQLNGLIAGIRDGKQISYEAFTTLSLPYPALPEQKKIADFLSAIDERIQYLTKKKELLEQYKKGVMQKIFSQKLRFKDESGKPFPKWEKKKLSQLVELKYGKEQKSIFDPQGKYSIVGTGGIIGKGKAYLIDRPTVVIGRKGSINKPIFYDQPIWPVDTAFYTIFKTEILPKWFYFQALNINWRLLNEASGVPSLSSSTIKGITFQLPSLPEQKKIADFLTAIDDKIEHVARQLEKTMEYKKGLLQQMFV